eukprot:TRINITY_DN30_c0_g1::TRINITY_DN30_c0_g1_i1::g.14798::m.14798 TRINITY_DN30_c0_g1::TRINITY_DN30_c0_g1_i1::g.14798  ORF type:complete len:186 (+),score=42.51,sp/P31421/GRM2_RAT/34.71/6e-13,ANF_receptor/PF01094.23/8e-24,Peripla_BP_6/PF13458.1/0.0025 TRINITY_DN30_c0_g1_i1:119-676(+)
MALFTRAYSSLLLLWMGLIWTSFFLQGSEAVTYNNVTLHVQVNLERLGTALLAIDRINNKTDGYLDSVLPNTRIDSVLNYTGCSSQDEALANALYASLGIDAAGVVGPSCSGVTMTSASLLKVFKIPQISPSATSPDLSNKVLYPYFLRTCSPDNQKVIAIADLFMQWNWDMWLCWLPVMHSAKG